MPLYRVPIRQVRDEGSTLATAYAIDFVGAGVTATSTGGVVTANIPGGGGGGGSLTNGTATLNFGAAPGTNITEVAVTGQASIGSGSIAKALLMGDATADHSAYEHTIVPLELKCGSVVAGTGFTITASSPLRLTGTFSVRWFWA